MEKIDYDETKEIVIWLDVIKAVDEVIHILDFILVGDEKGVFVEWDGESAKDFSIKSWHYGFTKKRLKEICKRWNEKMPLGYKATPIGNFEIGFKFY